MTPWAHYLFIGTSSQWPPVDSRHTDIFGCRFFWGIWTHILELWNVEYSKAAHQAPSIHPVSVVALPQNQVIFLDFENGKYTNNNRIWCFVHYRRRRCRRQRWLRVTYHMISFDLKPFLQAPFDRRSKTWCRRSGGTNKQVKFSRNFIKMFYTQSVCVCVLAPPHVL